MRQRKTIYKQVSSLYYCKGDTQNMNQIFSDRNGCRELRQVVSEVLIASLRIVNTHSCLSGYLNSELLIV